MNNDDFILQVKATYNQLTKAEKKVADFVLQNPGEVMYMSITDLADACKVGDTSVYRFCRTMKLQGYQEFKMKISLSQGANGIGAKGPYSDTDKGEMDSLAEKSMSLMIDAIRDTYRLLDSVNFEKALELFEKAQRVQFFGIGDSLLTAQEARNRFLRITNKVRCITDPHMQSMAASLCNEQDLVVIISYSGATKDNIHVAKVAKQAGAAIVCITHYKKSPLTAYSDAILLCGSNEGPLQGGSMMAKISQLYLIDLMYQEYYIRNFNVSKKNNESTSRSVVEKLY